MTSDHIKALAEDSQMARTALRVLLENPENIERLRQFASEDVMFARFCERKGIETYATWRELSRAEVVNNRLNQAVANG